MNKETLDTLEPVVLEIVDCSEKVELFASLTLGDNQHRREFTVTVRQYVDRAIHAEQKIKLRIDQIGRKDWSGDGWDITGFAMPQGKWVPVEGFVNTRTGHGNLRIRFRKGCRDCCYSKYCSQSDRFCRNCGAQMLNHQVPSLSLT